MLFGSYGGLMPGHLRLRVRRRPWVTATATLKSSVILSAVVTVFGVGLFSYILQVPMPVLEWRGL